VIVSSHVGRVPRAVRKVASGLAVLLGLALALPAGAAEAVLTLRAVGVGPAELPLTIEVFRWSSDAERSPLIAALAPAPAPPAAPAAANEAGGRAGRGGGGRGGRGGRGAAAPVDPMARLTSAIKAAPTVGFVWGDGVTGYSIKYAWRAPSADAGTERIVLVTDRRLGAHAPAWTPPSGSAADAEFTVIEMRVANGTGEGKTSLATKIAVDAAAQTLALEGYPAAPVQLKVTR
jgi:hypothetical protein